MSIETAQAFVRKVQSDEALRSEVIALGQDFDGLVQLAAKHGHSFSAEELKAAAQANGYNTGNTISEEDLKAVAGGLSASGDSCAGTGTTWTSHGCC
jgi:predicted ribosomally synthesized peptide with nif11-like leader